MDAELAALLRRNDDVVSVTDLVTTGVGRQTIARRIRTGHWQRPLPRIVVTHSGPLTADQRRRAALKYGGPAALLSHESAGILLDLRVSEDRTHITVPHGMPKASVAFVAVHQSAATLGRRLVNGLPCTNVSRTVVDIACNMRRLNDVRALVADSVQRGLTTIAALERAVARAPRHCPAQLRQAVEEVSVGARSAGEAEFLQLIRSAGLPMPQLNAPIAVDGRRFRVDALWSDCKVVVEIDGRAWHVQAGRWENDLQRQNLLHAAGYVIVRFPMRRLYEDPVGVIDELRAVLIARGWACAA